MPYTLQYTGTQVDACVGAYQTSAQVQNAIDQAIATTKLALFPIGSIYTSTVNTDPSTFIGGTWTQIKDKFILAAGDTYTAGATGGNTVHSHTTTATTTGSHTLTVAEMPAHKHNFSNQYGATGPNIYGASITLSGANNIILAPYHAYQGNNNCLTQLDTGGGGGHTHPQVSTSTTEVSNMPPYLVVYMWQRTA